MVSDSWISEQLLIKKDQAKLFAQNLGKIHCSKTKLKNQGVILSLVYLGIYYF